MLPQPSAKRFEQRHSNDRVVLSCRAVPGVALAKRAQHGKQLARLVKQAHGRIHHLHQPLRLHDEVGVLEHCLLQRAVDRKQL